MTQTATRRGLNRRVFLGLGTAAVAGIFVASYADQPSANPQISVEQALAMAETGEIILIDIRRPDEWRRTGIPQYGVPIDMRRRDFAEAVRAAAGDAPVALICARGVRSNRSARRLTEAGIQGVIDVPEGMLGSAAGAGWLDKGLPTVSFEGDG